MERTLSSRVKPGTCAPLASRKWRFFSLFVFVPLKSKAGHMRTSRVTKMEVEKTFWALHYFFLFQISFFLKSKAGYMRTSRVTEMEVEKKTERRNLKKEKIVKHPKY